MVKHNCFGLVARVACAGLFVLTVGSLLGLSLASTARADTIIKLDLGGSGPDVGMNAGGNFASVSDGDAVTAGDQDTAVTYTGFLSPIPSIPTSIASFSMSGLAESGPAAVFGGTVIQAFSGGQFSLFSPTNTLLLSGSMTSSTLTGSAGPPGTGGLFTTSVASVTGGSLAPLIVANSLSLSMSLGNINGGSGLSVVANALQPFLADGSVTITGTAAAPEPGTMALLTLGGIGLLVTRRRR